MYVRMDFEHDSMYMLQIPRDTFVGEEGGSAGKINGILPLAVNSGDKNPVSELAGYISQNFGLPIFDKYVTIDMDSLREIVDVFSASASTSRTISSPTMRRPVRRSAA